MKTITRKKPHCQNSIIQLVFTEESLRAKRDRARGSTGSIRQIEWAHMVTPSRLSLPERARKHFPGTTAGDTIYGIALPDVANEWQISWRTKKEMLGKRNLVRVGGKTKGAAEDGACEGSEVCGGQIYHAPVSQII